MPVRSGNAWLADFDGLSVDVVRGLLVVVVVCPVRALAVGRLGWSLQPAKASAASGHTPDNGREADRGKGIVMGRRSGQGSLGRQ
jgi:hypothetical protein